MSSASWTPRNPALLGADVLNALPKALQSHPLLRAVLLSPDDNRDAMAEILNRNGKNVLVPGALSSEGMITLATSWDTLSVYATPAAMRSTVAVLLPVVVPGFSELSAAKQDAVSTLLSATGQTVQVVRDTVEFIGVSGITDDMKESAARSSDGKIYLSALHDEGGKGRNKLEVLVRYLRADGTVSEAVLIGCLDTGKTGAENAHAIKERLSALGFSPDSVVLLIMTVDGAGRKAAGELRGYGLIYVVVCDAHNVNNEAAQAKIGFAVPKLDMLHP